MSAELDRRARRPGAIISKPATDKYREGWERIFGKDHPGHRTCNECGAVCELPDKVCNICRRKLDVGN
jgi:rubrerythrin